MPTRKEEKVNNNDMYKSSDTMCAINRKTKALAFYLADKKKKIVGS